MSATSEVAKRVGFRTLPDAFALPFLLAIAIVTVLPTLRLRFPIEDAFHNGEFVAAALTLLRGPPFEAYPYTIHGAVDFLPALAVDALGADGSGIVATTVLLLKTLSGLAVLLAVLAAHRIARILGASPWLLIPFTSLAVIGLGWRDVAFCASLYLFTFVMSLHGGEYRRRAMLVEALFGACVAFGLFWSFDRGLYTVASFSLPVLALVLWHRRGIVAIVAGLVSIPAIAALLPGMNVEHYLDNLFVLIETKSQWAFDFGPRHAVLVAIMALVHALAGVLVVLLLRKDHLVFHELVTVGTLVLACATYANAGLNRIDASHVSMALWAPLLLGCLVAGRLTHPRPTPALFVVIGVFSLLGAVLFRLLPAYPSLVMLTLAMLALASFAVGRDRRTHAASFVMATVFGLSVAGVMASQALNASLSGGYAGTLAAVIDPPTDRQAVADGVRWSGETLHEAGTHCVFDMVNNGLVNAVADLPACSQFTYPVYAGPQHEDRLIADLRATAPAAVLARADFWSFAIDDRSMDQRFPRLFAEILASYPNETCRFGYCVRTK